MRYVERNALAAGLVRQAEERKFGGLYNWLGGRCGIKLARWPVPRLTNWLERMNRVVSEKEEEQLKRCIARGLSFGEAGWVESTARRTNLKTTLRKRSRPRNSSQAWLVPPEAKFP